MPSLMLTTIKEVENYADVHDWWIVQETDTSRIYLTPSGNFVMVKWNKEGRIGKSLSPVTWNIQREVE